MARAGSQATESRSTGSRGRCAGRWGSEACESTPVAALPHSPGPAICIPWHQPTAHLALKSQRFGACRGAATASGSRNLRPSATTTYTLVRPRGQWHGTRIGRPHRPKTLGLGTPAREQAGNQASDSNLQATTELREMGERGTGIVVGGLRHSPCAKLRVNLEQFCAKSTAVWQCIIMRGTPGKRGVPS